MIFDIQYIDDDFVLKLKIKITLSKNSFRLGFMYHHQSLIRIYRLPAYCIHSIIYIYIYILSWKESKEREREKKWENTSVCLIIILLTVIVDHKDMGVENVAVYLPPAIFNDQVEEKERTEQSIPGCHRRGIIWLMAIIVVVLTYKKNDQWKAEHIA